MSCNAIEVRDISKTFFQYAKPSDRLKQMLFGKYKHYFTEYQALKSLSFELAHGQVLGLVGQNGAGKSTLLQLICGTLQPSTGSVTVNGRIAALLELGSGFNPEFTGRENVFLNASILGLSQEEAEAKYDSIVEFSGVGDFIEQPVKTYSSGMLVRLAFSVATSVEPDILIIDEALSVGDGAFARKSFDRIMRLKDQGCTILFCSHSLYQVEKLCDSVVWLNKGQMMAFGRPDQILPDYQSFLESLSSKSTEMRFNTSSASNLLPKDSACIERVEVSVDGQSTGTLLAKSSESELKVYCRFKFDSSLPCPGVAATISTQDGRIVASVATWNERIVPVLLSPGLGEAQVVFPQIPLLKGLYKVGVYLYCEQGLHNYEWIDPAAEVRVTQTDNEQGLIRLPHQWVEY